MRKPGRSAPTDRKVGLAREPIVQFSLSDRAERLQATYATGRCTLVFKTAGQAVACGSRTSILLLAAKGVAVTVGLVWDSR